MGHRTKTWIKNDVQWPDELLVPAENRVDAISNSFFFPQLLNNRSAADAVCYTVKTAHNEHKQRLLRATKNR